MQTPWDVHLQMPVPAAPNPGGAFRARRLLGLVSCAHRLAERHARTNAKRCRERNKDHSPGVRVVVDSNGGVDNSFIVLRARRSLPSPAAVAESSESSDGEAVVRRLPR